MNANIMLLASDARMQAVSRELQKAGWNIVSLDKAELAKIWVLPIPLRAESHNLQELFLRAQPGTLILGGHIASEVYQLFRPEETYLVDYYQDPVLVEKNAIPTAEGCIALLMEHSRCTLWHRHILITGFGRVGRALADRLVSMGAYVTVAARNPEQRSCAEGRGCTAVPLERLDSPGPWTSAINTIPAPILTEKRLANLQENSLIVDLASKPGGTDFSAAEKMGYTALHALGLPGKCAPDTAGLFIAQTILHILEKESEQI